MRAIFLWTLAAQVVLAQPATITDTITTPMGGNWSGTVVVSLNSPALAQPLYAGSVTLSGWSQTVTVTAGAFSLALYPNDQITPGGTSYQAKYSPASGAGWTETWVVPTGATTIREIRSTTLPSPSVKFNLAQLNQNGALLGQGLRWNGAAWAPGTFVADPMTTTGDLITRSGGVAVRVPIGTTGQVLTVAGGLPAWATNLAGNAATATALAANGTNCSAGQFPLGVDASGNAESCTALPTTIAGTTNQITASAATGAVTLSFPVGGVTLPGTTTGTFSGGLTGNASTATTLQTARTIAGVSFNGSANIAIPSTGLSDSSDLVRGGAAVASGRVLYGTAAGVAGTDAGFTFSTGSLTINSGSGTNSFALRDGLIQKTAGDGFIFGSSIRSTAVGNTAAPTFSLGGVGLGMYFPGSTDLGLATASVERARITSTGNLLLGTTTDDGTNRLQVAGSVAVTGSSASALPISVTNASTGTSEIRFANSTWGINNFAVGQDGTGAFMFANGSQPIRFFINSERARITPSGNLLLGTTTDGSFRLDIGSSGSSGTARIYDQTATTGVTQLVVRAGAGQSSTNLMTWQNSAGTQIASVSSGGGFFAPEFETSSAGFSVGSALARGANNFRLVFSSTGSYAGSADTGLARNAAGVLEINSGTAGTFRDLRLRDLITTLATPASSSATCTAGTHRADADYLYVCTATDTWKRVAIATW